MGPYPTLYKIFILALALDIILGYEGELIEIKIPQRVVHVLVNEFSEMQYLNIVVKKILHEAIYLHLENVVPRK